MSVKSRDSFDWKQITPAKAKVLAGLEDQQTEQRIAARSNVALSTIRTHVRELKDIVGCHDVRELGKWWRQNRAGWVAWCEQQAGLGTDELRTVP